jgi:hypothetical protein
MHSSQPQLTCYAQAFKYFKLKKTGESLSGKGFHETKYCGKIKIFQISL